MNAPRLSICIATLNRAAFIGATLDSLIAQAGNDVEIIVVDGASTDNTEQVVRERGGRFPHLRYERLPQKGGVDQDYCKAVALAGGEYCWLMSDDDLLRPGAIPAILDATRASYSLILVNAEVRADHLTTLVVPRLLPFTANRVYGPQDRNQFLAETATYMSFIGGIVVRRSLWEEREKEKFFGTEFIHIGVIFQKPLPDDTLVMAEPWITIRHGQASWSRRYFEIWMLKWPNLIWSLPDFTDEVKSRVCVKEPWRRPKILLVLRAKSAYALPHYTQFVEPRLTRRSEKWLAWLIAALPGALVNLAVYAYFAAFRRHELYGLREYRDSPFFYTNVLRALWQKLTLRFRRASP